MSLLARILVPIYKDRRTYRSFEHAVSLAERFQSNLLIAAVVSKAPFIDAVAALPRATTTAVNEKGLAEFAARLERKLARLIDEAQRLGLNAESVTIGEPCERPLAALTRQTDLIVENTPHRANAIQRLLGDTDIYRDTCCPVLVSGEEDFALAPALLVYNTTPRANRALRWLAALAEPGHIPKLHVLALYRGGEEKEMLYDELASYAAYRSLIVEIEMVEEATGFKRAVEKARELQAGVVVLPSFAFKKPLRLQGTDAKTLHELRCSALIFPKGSG